MVNHELLTEEQQTRLAYCDQLHLYARALEQLSADRIADLVALTHPDIRFRDPFHQSQGQEVFARILSEMYMRLDHVTFEVHQIAPSHHHEQPGGFLHWTFMASSHRTGAFSFQGTSRIEIDEGGLVSVHEDYWDSADLYRQVPGLKVFIRWLTRKVATA